MKIGEILAHKGTRVVTVAPELSLASAARRMVAESVGAVLVIDEDDRIRGLLSERDVMRAVALHGEEAAGLRVADTMSRSVVVCSPEDTVVGVMGIMTARRARHMPVIAGGKLSGIVSIGDLVKARLEESELETRVMRDVYIANR